MKRVFCLAVGVASLLVLFACRARTKLPPVPRIVVPYTEETVVFDAQLNEPCWQRAAVIEHWVGPKGEARGGGTRCRLLWTKERLLLAFEIEDSTIFATKTVRDDLLWKEDVFEAFIDPEGRGTNYFEFQFNPLGGIFDAFLLGDPSKIENGSLWSYDCKDLQAASRLIGGSTVGQAKGWVLEIGIPYSSLMRLPHTPPIPGDVWRMNLVRRDYLTPENPEEWCWSATGRRRWPHTTARFGYLQFGQ